MENKAELSLNADLKDNEEFAELALYEKEEFAELALFEKEKETEETGAELTVNESKKVVAPKYLDDNGNRIDVKLSRSITSDIIQSEETVKSYYSELKNHILSYNGIKSRISWKFDTYNKGSDTLFKIKLRNCSNLFNFKVFCINFSNWSIWVSHIWNLTTSFI